MNMIGNELLSDTMIVIVKDVLKKMLISIKSEEEYLLRNRLEDLLKAFRKEVHIKNKEVIFGLIFLKKIYDMKEEQTILQKISTHIDLLFIFISCLIIGYKMERIDHIPNEELSKIGMLNNKALNECEIFVIQTLNFNLIIRNEDIINISSNLNIIN
jgi:hypothetical protein